MARIRTIKPEFWTSEQVVECSPMARLLFIGLWNFCDDAGRHALSPKQAKAEVFPADDVSLKDITGWFQELSANGLIAPYTSENKQYFEVTGWHHQRIDKPQKARCPEPIQYDSKNVPRTLPPEGKGEESKGKEGKGEEEGASAPALSPQSAFDAYNERASELGLSVARSLTKDRRAHLKTRLAEHGEAGWRAALQELDSPFLLGQNARGWKADLDFVLQSKSFNRLIEGAYRDNPSHAPPPKEAHFRASVQQVIEEIDHGNSEHGTGRRAICGPGGLNGAGELHAATPRHEGHAAIVDADAGRSSEKGSDPDG